MPLRFHVMGLLALSVAGAVLAAFAWDRAGGQRVQRVEGSGDSDGLAGSMGRSMGEEVAFVDHDGRSVRLADFAGKVRLVFFGFTHCPDVCPTGLSTISLLLEELGEERRDVRALFITVDPERDTPEVMKRYVANFANGIIGLTGSPEQITAAAAAFHAYVKRVPQPGGGYTVDHSASILLLDRAGRFRGTIDIHEEPSATTQKLRRVLRQQTQPDTGK